MDMEMLQGTAIERENASASTIHFISEPRRTPLPRSIEKRPSCVRTVEQECAANYAYDAQSPLQ